MLDIIRIPAFTDNYIWLLHCPKTGAVAAIDPGDAGPVRQACRSRGWTLTHVLATHHHTDHVGGIAALKAETGCVVIGAEADARRLPPLDVAVHHGSTIHVGACEAMVLETPGHTLGHISYWFDEARALFPGDTLFSLGCGRMFEGTPPQYWASLQILRDLPDETGVFSAHEYTAANARFALSIDPSNPILHERATDIRCMEAAHQATLPTLLGVERLANPFLRADDPDLAARLGLANVPAEQVFAVLRRRKDDFQG